MVKFPKQKRTFFARSNIKKCPDDLIGALNIHFTNLLFATFAAVLRVFVANRYVFSCCFVRHF